MLLLSAGFILLFGTLRPLPISSRVQKEKFWADKVHAKKRYEAIIAGDSRVYRGVDPNSLSDEIEGMSVLNFGFSSGGFNDMMFSEINSRLLKQAPQKIIILGITPYSVTPKAQENKHFLQEKNRNPKEVFARRYINPFLSFFDPITPKQLLQSTDTISGYHETFHKNGWVSSYKVPSNPEAALKSYKNNFKENRVKQEVLKNLYQQISKWSGDGVKVYAFRMPSTQAMENLENALSGFNEQKIKEDIVTAGGKWLEIANKFEYESYDGSHLTELSAISFSTYLGKRISENLRSLN
jgi:hypothetical protein